ncbi:MAG: ABC-2 family transporter protein [Candidatus Nanohaloarchaea archaeon]|nr:ABC-2 family transporter protein [Candidatus Nanohaloarchaea archaeon]
MLRRYTEIARAGFRRASIYRLDTLTRIFDSLFFLLLMYYIWSAIAEASTLSRSVTDIIIYLGIARVVARSTHADVEGFIGERVRRGTIVNELKRPVSLRSQIFFDRLGTTAFHALTRAVPVLAVLMLILPVSFPGPARFAVFAASLGLSFLLTFALSYVVGMAVFWTKVGWSLRMTRSLLTRIMSGQMFPLFLLPAFLEPVFYSLPFHAMVNTPTVIFTGGVPLSQTPMMLGVQAAWFLVLGAVGEAAWRRARAKLTVQGG